jgi:carbon-monoxide dehydrogenase medium subunit
MAASFVYRRPATLDEAVAIFGERGAEARVLAGGTDLIIRLRDGAAKPAVLVDIKRIPELRPGVEEIGSRVRISATTTMTDLTLDSVVNRHFPALAEAASVVGSVQIRNRATIAGNICNASPAADSSPSLLVYGAEVIAASVSGFRRIPIDEFFVKSGVTTLRPDEFVAALELPLPGRRAGAAHMRRTRRRGHDLASVTLCCAVDEGGLARVAYGSVGPRVVLVRDESGVLADPGASEEAVAAVFEGMFAAAKPSATSMRAGPEYRLAMLRVLGSRGRALALERLERGSKT